LDDLSGVPGEAVLDWQEASIVFPVDRYGMSLVETLYVEAAWSLEFARCTHNTDKYPLQAIEEAVRHIKGVPVVHHWRFAWWNASYIAQYGFLGEPETPVQWMVDGVSDEIILECVNQTRDKGFRVIASGYMDDPESSLLTQVDGESMDRTVVDPDYLNLRDRLRSCLSEAGYAVYSTEPGSEWNSVKVENDWSEEKVTQSALAEAVCADNMEYTQQVANIAAKYQQELIRFREAEFIEVKKVSEERVKMAMEVLRRSRVL
jgi:hypothetical protein